MPDVIPSPDPEACPYPQPVFSPPDWFVRLINDLFVSGESYISDGQRGSGKTHFAVAVAWMLVCYPGPWGKVILLTNIIFLRKTAAGTVKDTPENVYHTTTMKDMLRTIGEILKEHGRNVRILILLDEAQNFMLSDLNADKTNLALIRWLGTARKYNAVTWLLSPSVKNFVPRIRNFPDDDEPGFMSGIFRKDNARARALIAKGLNCMPRDLTTVRYGRDGAAHIIPVPPSPWTIPPDRLMEGEFCYDHLSSADFTLGEGFDIRPFITHISDVASDDMPDAISTFFTELESGEVCLSAEKIILREKMEASARLKAMNPRPPESVIAAAVGMSESTWRRHWKLHRAKEAEEDVA